MSRRPFQFRRRGGSAGGYQLEATAAAGTSFSTRRPPWSASWLSGIVTSRLQRDRNGGALSSLFTLAVQAVGTASEPDTRWGAPDASPAASCAGGEVCGAGGGRHLVPPRGGIWCRGGGTTCPQTLIIIIGIIPDSIQTVGGSAVAPPPAVGPGRSSVDRWAAWRPGCCSRRRRPSRISSCCWMRPSARRRRRGSVRRWCTVAWSPWIASRLPIAMPFASRTNEPTSAWVMVWAIAAPDIRVRAAAGTVLRIHDEIPPGRRASPDGAPRLRWHRYRTDTAATNSVRVVMLTRLAIRHPQDLRQRVAILMRQRS